MRAEVGQLDIAHQGVRLQPVALAARRAEGQVPGRAAGGGRGVRQDRGQPVEQLALRLAGDRQRDLPALQFGPQDVQPAVQQAAQVRQVGLLLQGVPAQHPQLLQGQAGQPVERAHVHQSDHLP